MMKHYQRRLCATFLIFFFALAYSYGQEIVSPESICYFTNVEYTTKDLPPTTSAYKWSIESGTASGTPTDNASTYNVVWITGPVKVKLEYTYTEQVYNSNTKQYETVTKKATIYSSSQGIVNPPGVTYSLSITSDKSGNTICANDAIKLTANTSGGTPEMEFTYYWSTGEDTKEITVNPGFTLPFSVQTHHQCENSFSKSASITVNVNPLPDFSISANPSGKVCPATQVTLTAAPTVSGTTYNYAWATNNTQGSQLVVAPTSTSSYSVTATNPTTGCKKSVSKQVDVYPRATVQVDKSEILVCTNPATFTVTASGAYSYVWSPANLLTTPNNQATVSGSVDPATTPVVFNVIAKNDDPCTNTSASTQVTVYGGPPKAESILGYADGINGPASPAYLCMNPPDQTYSITTSKNSPKLTHYYWNFTTTGGASLGNYSGYGVTSVLAHFNTGFTGSKTLQVQATNSCGTGIIASFDTYLESSVPPTPSLSGVPSSVCNGTNTNITLNYMTSGARYEITPSNAVNWNTTTYGPYGSINIDWNDAFTGTAYIKARVVNGCGYSAYSSTYSINVVQTPKIFGYSIVCSEGPSVSYSLGQMTANTVWSINPSSAGSGFNNGPYGTFTVDWNTPANNQQTTATLSVTYPGLSCAAPTKTVTINPGTCSPSGKLAAYDDESSLPAEALSASVHPNPFTGTATLKLEDMLSGNLKVEIYNAKGIKVYEKDYVASGSELEVGGQLSPGLYTVMIQSATEKKAIKFIKQD